AAAGPHLTLHKTSCIPHGGGGPGIGPVAARSHLAPYLPVSAGATDPGDRPVISAAPHGSAGILPIPWAYLRMMGPDGLAAATGVAVLAANYVAARLREHYPVLSAGNQGQGPAGDNPLVDAPHTAQMVSGDEWSHGYPRSLGAYPAGMVDGKYWPPVRRIDGAYGDRHLVCSCPSPEAFED